MTDPKSPYCDARLLLDNLPLLIREARRRRGLSMRGVGREIGESFATVSRAEAGRNLQLCSALSLLAFVEQAMGNDRRYWTAEGLRRLQEEESSYPAAPSQQEGEDR